jgi:hypothetical protein
MSDASRANNSPGVKTPSLPEMQSRFHEALRKVSHLDKETYEALSQTGNHIFRTFKKYKTNKEQQEERIKQKDEELKLSNEQHQQDVKELRKAHQRALKIAAEAAARRREATLYDTFRGKEIATRNEMRSLKEENRRLKEELAEALKSKANNIDLSHDTGADHYRIPHQANRVPLATASTNVKANPSNKGTRSDIAVVKETRTEVDKVPDAKISKQPTKKVPMTAASTNIAITSSVKEPRSSVAFSMAAKAKVDIHPNTKSKKEVTKEMSAEVTTPKVKMSPSNNGTASSLAILRETISEVHKTSHAIPTKDFPKKRKAGTDDEADMAARNAPEKKRLRTEGPAGQARKATPPSPRRTRKLFRRPTGIRGRDYETYNSSVVQALAATLNVEVLKNESNFDLPVSANAGKIPHEDKAKVEAARAFVDLMTNMSKERGYPAYSDLFTNAFSKIEDFNDHPKYAEADASDFLQHIHQIMEAKGSKYVGKACTLLNQYFSVCETKGCPSNNATVNDYDETPFHTMRPRKSVRSDRNEEINITLPSLLAEGKNMYYSDRVRCPHCNQISRIRGWKRLDNEPEVLTFKFQRCDESPIPSRSWKRKTGLRYTVDLPQAHDFSEYMPGWSRLTKYTLKAVVKHNGKHLDGGFYTAYTRTDARWWRCQGADISAAQLHDINSDRDGEAYLAFYTRDG